MTLTIHRMVVNIVEEFIERVPEVLEEAGDIYDLLDGCVENWQPVMNNEIISAWTSANMYDTEHSYADDIIGKMSEVIEEESREKATEQLRRQGYDV